MNTATRAEIIARGLDLYNQSTDTHNARTRQLCTEQPDQQPVHTALLHLEKGAETAGWDTDPRLFTLRRHADTGVLRSVDMPILSEQLRLAPGSTSDVLLGLATAMEFVRAQAELPPEARKAGTEGFVAGVGVEPGATLAPDADMLGDSEGWAFLGAGLVTEAWAVLQTGNRADDRAVDAFHAERRLKDHPLRIEARQVFYCGRDGLMWQLERLRATTEVPASPRRTTIHHHDADLTGDLPHGLSRLCNAMAGNPVPIFQRYAPA